MKTNKFFICAILTLSSWLGNAQATESNNNITSGSYLGTSNDEDVVFKRNAVNAGLISENKTTLGVDSNVNKGVSIGNSAGKYSTPPSTGSYTGNVFIGNNSGSGTSINPNVGWHNVYIGENTGTACTSGISNTAIGAQAMGGAQITGGENVTIGSEAGFNITDGSSNVYIGARSGSMNSSAVYNIAIGTDAGYVASSPGNTGNNIFIGAMAGYQCSGAANVLIGSAVGSDFTGNNTLMIDNFDFYPTTAPAGYNPLIWGNFADDQLKFQGKVGIGGNSATEFGSFPSAAGSVDVSGYNLFVKGGILTEEVRVTLNGDWADYVFAKDYKLKPLADVEQFIKQNGHLPNVPSAQKVKEDGIELGDMAKIQQEKIEELTLYIIQQNKINEAQNKLIQELSQRLNTLEKR